MTEKKQPLKQSKDLHPLVTIGLLTAGTQMGSTLIQRMGRHPFLLFAMGVTAGVYTYKNRKEIIAETQHLKEKSKKILSMQAGSE
jgi:zinc transporter ZupT